MQDHLEPQRALGTLSSAALLAGTVIGTGIFLVPSTIARETGSIAGVFFIWIFGALLSLAGALTYAELGSSFPESGGEYAFLRRAYGPFWGFLFGWQQIVIGKTGSLAGLGIAFAVFLSYFVGNLDQEWVHSKTYIGTFLATGRQCVAVLTILLLTWINVFKVTFSGLVQSVLTVLKISALLALVVVVFSSGNGSIAHFYSGWSLHSTEESSPLESISGLGAALAAALWAYDGWNNLTLVGAEIRHPDKTIPQVLIVGIMGVALVYLLTNAAYFYALPFETIQHSTRVAQEVADAVLGRFGGTALTIAALISTLAALNGSILSGSRVFYAMARDRLLFRVLYHLHPVHRTPHRALVLQAFLASCLVILFGHDRVAFERVLDYALFGTWGFYGITVLAVIVLRYRHPEWPRPYLTLGYPWIPLLFAFVSFLFCLSIAWRRPTETCFGITLLLVGLPFYYYRKKRQA